MREGGCLRRFPLGRPRLRSRCRQGRKAGTPSIRTEAACAQQLRRRERVKQYNIDACAAVERLTCVALHRAVDAAAPHNLHGLVAAGDDDAAVAGVESIDVHTPLQQIRVSECARDNGNKWLAGEGERRGLTAEAAGTAALSSPRARSRLQHPRAASLRADAAHIPCACACACTMSFDGCSNVAG